jgi:hypothetical protein
LKNIFHFVFVVGLFPEFHPQPGRFCKIPSGVGKPTRGGLKNVLQNFARLMVNYGFINLIPFPPPFVKSQKPEIRYSRLPHAARRLIGGMKPAGICPLPQPIKATGLEFHV